MTAPRFGAIAAIVRKDFISLWPLVFAALIVPVAVFVAENSREVDRPWRDLVIMLGMLSAVLVVLSVFHQDGMASVRHDWRTRPVGSATLLCAKLIFIALTVLLPAFFGQLASELFQGHSMGEALWAALFLAGAGLVVLIPVILVAIATLTIIEAGVIGFAVGLAAIAMGSFATYNPLGGSQWVATLGQIAVLAGICGMTLWLHHRRVTGIAPKVALAGGLTTLFAALIAFPTPVAVAVENAASPKNENLDRIQLVETGACRGGQSLRIELGAEGIPAGSYLQVDRTSLVLSTPDKQRTGYSLPGTHPWSAKTLDPADGEAALTSVTILPRRDMRNATFGKTRRHDLTLLRKGSSEDLVIDGPRRLTNHFGYCSAVRKRHSSLSNYVFIDCFNPLGGRPDMVNAEIVGAAQTSAPIGSRTAYGPALLRSKWGNWSASAKPQPGIAASTVRLTAFTATAHFSRTTEAGPTTPAACPAWPT